MGNWTVGVVLGFAACCFASAAFAEPPGSTADVLFSEGVDAMRRGDYSKAREKLLASQGLDPAAGTLFNLAECEEHLGNYVAAREHWLGVVSLLPPSDERHGEAKKHLQVIEATKIGWLTLTWEDATATKDAVVLLDTVQVPPSAVGQRRPLGPGEHVVVVQSVGRFPWQQRLLLVAGEDRRFALQVGQLVFNPQVVAPVSEVLPSSNVESRSFLERHSWSTALAGAALGLGALGTGFGIRTIDHYGEVADACVVQAVGCKDGGKDAIRNEALATNLLFGFAAGAAVGSVVLAVIVERSARPKEVRAWISPGGATLGLSF